MYCVAAEVLLFSKNGPNQICLGHGSFFLKGFDVLRAWFFLEGKRGSGLVMVA